jgi:serine/threonine protein kinase
MEFIRKVGEGAYKQTFEVISIEGAKRALKIFKPGTSTERNKRELDAMLRCNHPNIAKVHFVGPFKYASDTLLTTLEEFLPGGPLPNKITKAQCFSYGSELIEALKHLESLRLVHRDLKPDNILFREDGQTPVIVDFGLVRDLSDISVTPTWFPNGPGTPLFSSPEQLNNDKDIIDCRSDQFSLGITLSIAVLGVHPYTQPGDTNPWDPIARVGARQSPSGTFERDAELCLPALAKMVAPWPVQRFRTAEKLAVAWKNQKGAI